MCKYASDNYKTKMKKKTNLHLATTIEIDIINFLIVSKDTYYLFIYQIINTLLNFIKHFKDNFGGCVSV